MTVTEIVKFNAKPGIDSQAPYTNTDRTTEIVTDALKAAKCPEQYVFGTQVQDQSAAQITSEWKGIEDYASFPTDPKFSSFVGSVSSIYGEPREVYHVALNRSAFGVEGPATANVVEYAQSYFPASRITPEFEKQIEEDFLRFDKIVKKDAKGDLGLAFGWTLEELDHDDIEGKARGFVILRGWESMEHFEQLVKGEAFKEAVAILYAWKAPFKMVSDCFGACDDVTMLTNDSGMLSASLNHLSQL